MLLVVFTFLSILLVVPAIGQTTATIQNSAPPSVTGSNAPTTIRPEHDALRAELLELTRRLKVIDGKMGLGNEAKKKWDDTSSRVNKAIESHTAQVAACAHSRNELKRRIADGTPRVYLQDAEVHVKDCDDASSRLWTKLSAIKTDVEKLLRDVKYVEENVVQLAGEKTERLTRKTTIDQMLDLGTSSIKGKIDEFQKFRGY